MSKYLYLKSYIKSLILLVFFCFVSFTICSANKTMIGGDFVLIDHEGKIFNSQSLKGKKTLLYFGYTFCPDFCPATLNNLSVMLNDMTDTARSKINVIFITVDPERDTQKVLSEYMSNFHPQIIGLTGTKEQIEDVIKKFKIYAAKIKNPEHPDLYTVNHTTVMFMFDEKMDFLTAFPHDADLKHIQQYLAE